MACELLHDVPLYFFSPIKTIDYKIRKCIPFGPEINIFLWIPRKSIFQLRILKIKVGVKGFTTSLVHWKLVVLPS